MRVLLTETRWLEVEIDAETPEDALLDAQARYGGGEIGLDANSGASVKCVGTCGDAEMKLGSWDA